MEKLPVGHGGYHDLYFRIIVAGIGSHMIVSFGEKESFFQLLAMADYYRSMLFSCIIAFLLLTMVYGITVRLDRRYGWQDYPLIRAGLQAGLGFLLPAVMAFLLAMGYFKIFGYHILDTRYLQFDFPVIVLMLLLVNVYYLAYYFYRQWQIAAGEASRLSQVPVTDSHAPQVNSKQMFVVQRGAQNIPLPVTQIACFYRDGDYNFLKTFEGDSFLVSQPLDDVEQQLDGSMFFRANRQWIVQYNACSHFSTLEFGKLELFIKPQAKESIVISQRKARMFKDWMER